ncbi:hypothetical protein LXA43DRAFT_1155890 [Ganoderma leucocontextum]|nr:hypothetical protein LXA43DRAFT_1155890 [Ganoderma leucocontextum]
MSSKQSPGCRLGIFHDTGAPEGSADYTTLVILHGYIWHSAIFTRLIPLTKENNTRLILLNRRGYPGSAPYTEQERAAFPALLPKDACQEDVDNARERLELFLRERTLQASQRATWSWANPGYGIMGYPAKEGVYQPALDVSLPEEQRAAALDAWIGGYYAHGSTLDSLDEIPLVDPPSTISTLTLKRGRLRPTHARITWLDSNTSPDGDRVDVLGEPGTRNGWRDVEMRVVWCEKSVMEVAYGMMLLGLELEDARRKGAWIRNVSIVHWDRPDLVMRAFIGEEREI